MDEKEVTTAKLAGVYRAPTGTSLPTDATSTLSDAFNEIGDVSEDGITKSYSRESTEIRNMNGETVLTVQSKKDITIGFKGISYLNIEAVKAVYGDDNVSGTFATSVAIEEGDEEPEEAAWVIDTICSDETIHRIVVPRGKLSDLGDIVMKNNEAVGFDLKIACLPDNSKKKVYEYFGKASN